MKTIPKWLPDVDEKLLHAFIDNPYECPVLIDDQGIVRFMSRYNTEAYGMSSAEAVGKHVKEVIKDTCLNNVLRSGKAEIGKVFYVGGRKRIVARIPLKDREGNVIGALTKLMFHQTEKITELYHRMEILEEHVKYYQSEIAGLKGGAYVLEQIIGESPVMKDTKKLTLQAAGSDASVLITGESGTGKELFAEAIHQKSRRVSGPFIKVNCAAIPHELIESELFGFEGGSFTGARQKGKLGKFQLADGGTIFLDEIGDMPIPMQAKLLRVLQDHEIERVGGIKPLKVDFRAIAATNQDLERMIQEGGFRMDLFYRLDVFRIRTPSLREMPEDIPRILYYFLSRLRGKQRRTPSRISGEAMALLKHYPWPGNVRELENLVERSMNVAERDEITVNDLPNRLREFYRVREGAVGHAGLLRDILMDAEKSAIVEALHVANGNKAEASRVLGIHRTGLYQKIRYHQIKI